MFRRGRRSSQQGSREEPSLLDVDDNFGADNLANASSKSSATPKRNSFLKWSASKKADHPVSPSDLASSRAQSPGDISTHAGVASPLPHSSISPRLSTSSRTSIFERSVDVSVNMSQNGIAGNTSGAAAESGVTQLVDTSHVQLIVENQIPSVLDASVEAITSNEDLDKVEIVTAQPMLSSENLSVPQLSNPWSEEENISTSHVPLEVPGTAKRLSFVSYADLVGLEQAEAEAKSLHSYKSISPKPLSPDSTGLADLRPEALSRPISTPTESLGRRQKSVVTLTIPTELELTRTTMADTILAPTQMIENENPWAN